MALPLQYDPTIDVRDLKERARTLILAGRWREARQAYEQALANKRADPLLWVRHAELCERLSDMAQAAESFLTAGQLFMKHAQSRHALAALNRALRLFPTNPRIQEAHRLVMRMRAE